MGQFKSLSGFPIGWVNPKDFSRHVPEGPLARTFGRLPAT